MNCAMPCAPAELISAARNRLTGSKAPGESSYASLPVLPVGVSITAYLIHLRVTDRPGVLAAVAGEFAAHGTSIRSLNQKGEGSSAELLILTHPGRESDLAQTVAALRAMDVVDEVQGVMRVIGEGR